MDTLAAAIDLYRRGNAREAELACERRLVIAGDDAEALSLLAEIRLSTGRVAHAVEQLTRLTELRPRDAAAHRRLAGALLALSRFGEAAATLRAAILIDPRSARAHNNLGQAQMQLGQLPDAIASYQEALRLDPGYAIAHSNYGLAQAAAGDLDAACESFRRATAAAPTLVEAWVGLGSVSSQRQQFETALVCFETALRLRPGDITIIGHKASVLLTLERAEESLDCVDELLRVAENSAEAHNLRAGALRRLGRFSEALHSLERALALAPGYVEGWCNRAMVLHEMGDFEAAVASYRRALELDPDETQARTRLLSRLIPSVPLSEEEVRSSRRAFEEELRELERWLSTRAVSEKDAFTVAEQQFFYLSYQEESNRPLLERYRSACARRLADFPQWSQRSAKAAFPSVQRSSQRFKLGFVSAQVYDHSVFNAILQGWLDCLDRTRFEVTLFSTGSKQDALTRTASRSVEHFESGARPVAEWVRAIRHRDLDALIFPEIGMHSSTLALASLRLAERQFAAWGHPETSGLPTIDGYLSAELFEPADAQAHYSEHLVRLPNLGVHCRPYAIAPAPVDLAAFGIVGRGPVLLCPGVPYKYRPGDDRVLVEIARRLEHCVFVFFQHDVAELSLKLQKRLAAAFRDARLEPAKYLVWIPWQPRHIFFGLLRETDVYLDTIGFSGFNTLIQAMECHLPCVTYEGRFMRGRLGSGILRRLGLAELIATDRERYVELAVELAARPAYRAEIRARIRTAEAALYGDIGAVDALARVLLESPSRP